MWNLSKKISTLVLGPLLACTVGAGAVLAEPAAPETVDISAPALVYDGDPGSDDAFALFLLKQNGKVPDLVLATFGNAPEKQTYANAALVTRALDMKVTVLPGADRSYKGKKWKNGKDGFNGEDGLYGISEAWRKKLGLSRNQLESSGDLALTKKQLKQRHHITYLATGPLSTLADLLQDPDIKSRIDRVWIVGGNLWEDPGDPEEEANFSRDPRAVEQVLKSGLDITLFPLDLTSSQIVDEPEIQKLAGYGTYPEFLELLRGNQAAHAQRGMENAAVLHDIFPVLYLLDAGKFTGEDKKLAVDTRTGALTEAPDGATVHVVLGVNPRTQWRALERAFQNHGADSRP